MTTDDAARFWDSQASTFDNEPDHGLLDPSVRAAWHDLLAGVLPAPPADVADLGCGTGSVSVLLAEVGYRVTGLDLSPMMVAAARAKVESQNSVCPTFFVGDAADPGLAPRSFDAIVVRHVMWALRDPRRSVERWARSLREGGVLVIVEGVWSTGAGITAQRLGDQVGSVLPNLMTRALPDARLWGGPITDDRYLLVARA